MKKHSNVATFYHGHPRNSSKVDWNKQMVFGAIYPGKVYYEQTSVYLRENKKNVFSSLNKTQIKSIFNDVHVGDQIKLKDSADANMGRFVNDIMRVESIYDDGKITSKLQYQNVYIDFLPQMDLLVNLNRGNKVINHISYVKERGEIYSCYFSHTLLTFYVLHDIMCMRWFS